MTIHKTRSLTFLLLTFSFFNCISKHKLNEEDNIFQGAPASGGIGSLSFALYKNHKYQVCESSGIGQTCFTGNYTLINDTIILQDLNKDCYLKNNRLLICNYNKQDSIFWKWKYPKHINNWKDMKERDISMGNEGDIHQIDNQNKLVLDQNYYFVFKTDIPKNYR